MIYLTGYYFRYANVYILLRYLPTYYVLSMYLSTSAVTVEIGTYLLI